MKRILDDILFKKGWNKNWDEWVGETRIMKQVSKTQKTQKISLSMTPGARKLREAEETVAKPRGCEQGSEEGGQGGEEEEGWI